LGKQKNRNFGLFGLQENINMICAQEARFHASELEKTLQEIFLWVFLMLFSVFCETKLAFHLERNADFLRSK
jgi:hypothetical protein